MNIAFFFFGWMVVALSCGLSCLEARLTQRERIHIKYRIAGNFRWVLIFAISRTAYGVAKIKNAIIYSNRNSKVGSFVIAKIKIAKIISLTSTFKSRKFSSAKISRYTVLYVLNKWSIWALICSQPQ